MKIDPDANRWFALEIDLEYPDNILNLHNDYPLAVEKKCVSKDDLSPYKLQSNLSQKSR